jgi:putative ABC transport system ATP-binding protein
MMYSRLNQLSTGQQQRVAIARAVANEPSIILVDEPTPRWDSRARVEVMGVLRELTDRGTTVIFATKEPLIASFATRQIVLREGMIFSDGANDSPRRASEVLVEISQADMERGVAA